MTFFLIKAAVPPMLAALASLVARRWGPTVGGLFMGLPWMTGPILLFLGIDKGGQFAVDACTGIQLGVLCICVYVFAYAALTSAASWPVCLAAGTAAFAGGAAILQHVSLPLLPATALAAAGLLGTYRLLPRPCSAPTPAVDLPALPWWDIPARMLATFVLVAAILLTADLLGPQLSGIISTFPVVLSVVSAFTQHQWGRDAALRVLRGISLSLLSFVAFFLVVGVTLPAIGLPAAFVLATATALAASAAVVGIGRTRAV